MGGHKGVGSPLCEIHGAPREPTLPILRGPLNGLCAVADISRGEMEFVAGEVFAVDCGSRMERVTGPMVALFFLLPVGVCRNREEAGLGSISPFSRKYLFVNTITRCQGRVPQ